VQGIIGLPANLFYGTSIAACIVVIDKENAHHRSGIFMIDASKGFVKDGNKNRLRAQDLHKIVDTFTRQLNIDEYSRMVPLAEFEKQDFNLNVRRYIDSSEPEDLQDIEAHLKGGIPNRDIDALQRYWDILPALRGELFGPGGRPNYSAPLVDAAAVKSMIFQAPEFAAFSSTVAEVFAGWRLAHLESLKSLNLGDHPKELIASLSEDLLTRFAAAPLINKYDVYQHLMSYWAEVMQDDVYIIVQEGWGATKQVRELVRNKEGKFTETPDITIGRRRLKAELIPPSLIVARFFAADQAELEKLEERAEEAARAIEELDEEQRGEEEGLLFEAKSEKGKLTAKSVRDRLRDIKHDPEAAEERRLLAQCLSLIEKEAEASRAAKEAKAALDIKTITRYGILTEAETKALVVEDKWLGCLAADVEAELDGVSHVLTGRVKLLSERYSAPLSKIAGEVEVLSAKVDAHLKRMGFAWN
jgi:type I restriction enzyme M protein